MEKYKARIQELQSIIDAEKIDLKKLRNFVSKGCPNESGFRSLIWKILLGYLPIDKFKWEQTLNNQRKNYSEFVREIILRPGLTKDEIEVLDHPLNFNPDSKWDGYFKDNEILLQIDKDVRRLCPDLAFFNKATEYPCCLLINEANSKYESLRKRVARTELKSADVIKDRMGITNLKLNFKNGKKQELSHCDDEYVYLPNGQEAHWEVVERILFIFAKLNPGQSYVQGMNEICGPLYYTFCTDPNEEWRKNAEADCFYCFTYLMGLAGVRDNFVQMLDNTEWGITSNMKRLFELIRKKDAQVYQVLIRQQLKPEFFAFRWLTLLLSQEFELPDVIAIWDVLFADSDLFDLLLHICCSMVL